MSELIQTHMGITPEQHSYLKDWAKRSNVSMSALMRMLVQEKKDMDELEKHLINEARKNVN